MGDLNGLGPRGEAHALELLRSRGHRLLQRNFRCPLGELDLITWHRRTLVFSEVRTHTKGEGRLPSDSITPEKQARLLRAAQWYLARRLGQRQPPPCRFDVVWMQVQDERVLESGVIEGAFTA